MSTSDQIMQLLKLPRGATLWFTGQPCSGKTTIARELFKQLESCNIPVILLDGDEVRPLIASGISHSTEGRRQSLDRYIGLVTLLLRSRVLTLVAVNQHAQAQREIARAAFMPGRYLELWVDTSIEECMRRDVKGLYAKARAGEIDNLVGFDIDFEPPKTHDLRIATAELSAKQAAKWIVDELATRAVIEVST